MPTLGNNYILRDQHYTNPTTGWPKMAKSCSGCHSKRLKEKPYGVTVGRFTSVGDRMINRWSYYCTKCTGAVLKKAKNDALKLLQKEFDKVDAIASLVTLK